VGLGSEGLALALVSEIREGLEGREGLIQAWTASVCSEVGFVVR
jgi:hypothetical protein